MATVFLDLDGTLIDPYLGISTCFIHAMQSLGLPAPSPDGLQWLIGPALFDSFAKIGVHDPELALRLYRERYCEVGLFEAEIYPGIPGALAALKSAGHTLHLATAKPHIFAKRITAHFDLDQYLDHQFGPEMNGTRNDKGELLAHALELLGETAETCIMVGDRHHDYDAARTVGMRSLAVRWGFGNKEEWCQADGLCEKPDRLAAMI